MTKYHIVHTKEYKKDAKKLDKKTLIKVEALIDRLANDEILEPKFKDHALKGEFKGLRECHVKPDLLLIYEKIENLLILNIVRIGSHSKLF